MRIPIVVAVVIAAGGVMVASASAATEPDALTLVRSYVVPASETSLQWMNDRGWTYDSTVVAAADASTGRLDAARAMLDQLAALQKPNGAIGFSFDVHTGQEDTLERTGVVAWLGLAAAQYRTATGSDRYDALMDAAARWLLAQRVTGSTEPGRDLMRGGPDVSWISTEHNLEARAFLARLAGTTADPAFAAELRDAVAAMDASIDRELFVSESATRAHFGQGVNDGARPIDAQALGIQWLLGQGRLADAQRVATAALAELSISDRTVEGHETAGTFAGHKPYVEGWGPDVLWMEGTLQLRMALAALGSDVSALDADADRWSALSPDPNMSPQADMTVVGNPAGDYHPWLAAAPAAWLRLSRSGSALLR